jgi:hypothetical protein
MGYRSDVTVAIYPDERKQEKYDMLKVLMGTTFKDVNFDDCMEWHDDGCVLAFNITDMKWYEADPDVRVFLSMLANLAGETEDGIGGYNYEMLRLGEDDDDTEFSNGGKDIDGILRLSRVVDIDV